MWTCPKCGEMLEDQFDSCWKCAAEPEQAVSATQKLSFSFFASAALMAILAPLFADCLHSVMVVTGGYRLYNAELSRVATTLFWILVAARAVITLLVIWFFARLRFRDIWVWSCLVALWTYADIQMEVTFM
jgi:hypothetical protein